jgi:predicted MFS family arabinose efflux permease
LGTKNTIIIGLFLVMFSTVGLGALARVLNGNMFRVIALGLRFIQGTGDIMLQITCYGVICQLFNDDIMRYIGYIEISVGVGAGLGPGIGGQLYPYLKYEWTMYVFGIMCLLGMALGVFMIPGELNETATDEEVAELELIEDENEENE